ncbi:MAG: hypothetical protein KDA22_05620, partial [Phycisphaerales bacterium]|nr:hypothetical protein [Phycisphaerales bacterium]
MTRDHSFMLVRLGAIAALSYSAQATVIHVPADQPTIQGAINVAVNGDTVLVAPGGYAETISFLGKAIEVRAEQDDDPTLTVIDGSGFGAVAAWVAGEGRDTKLVGFTLQNAVLEGVAIINSSPTIVRCRMVNNGGGAVAHGALINDGSPLFRECRFVGTAI